MLHFVSLVELKQHGLCLAESAPETTGNVGPVMDYSHPVAGILSRAQIGLELGSNQVPMAY